MPIVLPDRFRSVVLLATPPTRERSREDASDIDGPVTQAKPRPGFPTERSNGAYGKSNIEGKTAREAASELGKERVSNERERMSQRGAANEFQALTSSTIDYLSVVVPAAKRLTRLRPRSACR